MAEKKAYPLRISPAVLEAMQKWADDELRSVNAQIEFLLRRALAVALVTTGYALALLIGPTVTLWR